MKSLKGLSVTSGVLDWMIRTRRPRILHVFGQACNLINERSEILSIVTPQIGNGPFNVVIESDLRFYDCLHLESLVCVSSNHIRIGDFTVQLDGANLWNPRPDWTILHARKDDIFTQVIKFPIPNSPISLSSASSLSSALAIANISSAKTIASRLAGLGIGLTPTGDDFIVGALYAAWIVHPPEIAGVMAQAIANTAAPLTTSLSGAWLRAAGKGETGILWHEFFDALVRNDAVQVEMKINSILAVGETSGADAWGGFLGVFRSGRKPHP